ncbi:MAG: 2-dehydropantoate 2-reductase [Chloroflexi bacterium]|nr:2-dehydropantoate 2-reductase [Chloroflexota bacterium]
MNILVYGAGAIGGYIGGSLILTGHHVTFIARPGQAEVLNKRGLALFYRDKAYKAQPLLTVTNPAEALTGDNYDCIIIALKSFDTETVIADLKAIGKPPPILCLQNGVDNEPKLAAAFGAENVLAGTVLTAVANPKSGVIVVEKKRGAGIVGGHPLSQRLAAALSSSGVFTKLYPNAEAMKWTKLLTNLMGNATAAICDVSTEKVFTHPGLYAIEIGALKEALAVMRAKGLAAVALPRSPTLQLAFALQYLPPRLYQPAFRQALAGGRGKKKPSLHLDLIAGKARTEISYLNGAVARHAEALGLRAPINHALTEMLEGIVAGRISWDEYRGKPDKLAAGILQ